MKPAKPPPRARAVTPDCPPPEAMAEMVRMATLAPSMHNTQPWRFRVLRASQTVELYTDPARILRYGDVNSRAAHIACGAALFNLRLAVAMAGREPVVRLLPDDGNPMLLAELRLAGLSRPGEEDSGLYAAIPARHTNRQPFSSRPVPQGVLAELVEAASLEGAVLHLPDHDETARLLYLVADAERALIADPAYRAELARWVGGKRDSGGIPDSAIGPRDPGGHTPARDFSTGTHQPVNYAWFEEIPQLAVLSTASGTRMNWLRAGQALQRVLLSATARGISASALTQPLETADAWLVRDPRSGSEKAQMILRIGYGLPVPATPRRPIAEVLDIEPLR